MEPILTQLPPKINQNKIPDWLINSNYPEAEQDIKQWYESYFFWRKWDGKEETVTELRVRARAIAEAKFETLQQTNSLAKKSEKSALLQLYEAKKTGWFSYINEIEDVKELLEQVLEENIEAGARGGQRYELEFIINSLLPVMEKLGISAGTIIGSQGGMTKAQLLVPTARQLLRQENQEQAYEEIVELMEAVGDPNITKAAFKEIIREKYDKSKPEPIKAVQAEVYLVPNAEIIVIESNRSHTMAIERALSGIAEGFQIRDAFTLVRSISRRLLPKRNELHKCIVAGGKFIENENGYDIPSPDAFQLLIIEELVHNRHTLNLLIEHNIEAQIMIYPIQKVIRKVTEIGELFGFEDEDPMAVLSAVAKKSYPVPEDIDYMDYEVEIGFGKIESTDEIGFIASIRGCT